MNTETRNDKAMFDAYVSLRKIAQKYDLEEKLAIPRIVFVGETSAGKSMLVQNFLLFPCAFSQSDVGTRCPVLYRLRYNPSLEDDVILIKHPEGLKRPEDLAEHLRLVMECIGNQDGFSLQEYLVHIESNKYRDFEILDVPGLICGSRDAEHVAAVERITEHYVRDPTFLIVELKEATQLGVNSFGMKRIREFCLNDPAPCGSTLPPRLDYEEHTLTIQTKFDLFMESHREASQANDDLGKLVDHFNQRTLFLSMIFDAYNFGRQTYQENKRYIADLSEREKQRVDDWIQSMKQTASISGRSYGQFDEARFRPLIGINLVRNRIQDMWVKAFRRAIPKIQQVLYELIQEEKGRYETLISVVGEKDLNSIRDSYQRYIQSFRSTLSRYVSFRAEINTQFEHEVLGRTYAQIEEEYDQWTRKQIFTWPAHQTAEQMGKEPTERRLDTLVRRYVGARHFERLRQVFFYMILTYQPMNRERDWIESAEGLLYGGVTDSENLEKGVRELLYTYIRETFIMGICWLTQMYSFFLEHFEKHVRSVLLGPDGEFASLSMGHEKFLSHVRLEYHRVTRQMVCRAVEASKHARQAKMIYAAHNIGNFLRLLVESFPPTISSDRANVNLIAEANPLRLIYNTDTFLPANRNAQTGNYLPAVKSTTHEIFAAVRGLLLQDVTMTFFANVVVDIQRYESIDIPNALQQRLEKMSNEEIAHLSQIDFEQHIRELQEVYEKLIVLEEAGVEIDNAIRLFDGKTALHSTGKKNLINEKRDRRHQEIMNKLYQVKNKEADGETEPTTDEYIDSLRRPEQDEDEYQLDLVNNDSRSCEQYLIELYRKHDGEDLKLGLLPGDNLLTNKPKPPQRPTTSSASAWSSTLPRTNQQQNADPDYNADTRSNASSTKSDDSASTNTLPGSNRAHQDKSKTKWYRTAPK